jgi:DNA-binding SARP family transcriptional activator/TolB-like protein
MSELLTLGRVRLVSAGSADPSAGSAQPKRIALLGYLTLATGRNPVRRDALLALFWPELGDDEGRRALRQALYYLRRAIGEDVFIASGDELRIRPDSINCDAVEFDRLIDADQAADALLLYQGDFFNGFHVDDVSAEFEEWVDRTRVRLRRRASTAAWAVVESSLGAGDRARAIEFAEQACALDPDQESGWRRLMALHERLGDRPAALRTYETLAQRLEREFDAAPSDETTALAARIRASTSATGTPTAPAMPVVEPSPALRLDEAPAHAADVAQSTRHSPSQPATARGGARRRMRVAAAGVVALAAVGVALASYVRGVEADEGTQLVATGSLAQRDRLVVASFANLAGDSLLAAAVTEAFRVDLSQSTVIRVLSPREVAAALEHMARPVDAPVDDSLAREVAVRQGAKAVVAGSIAKVGSGYTVAVQLIGTEHGDVLAAFRESAADSTGLLGALDRASKQLRHRIGESLRELRDMPALEEETTGSLAALREYTAGQRFTLAGHRPEAIRAYEKAIALDSAFAGAWSALGMVYGSIAEQGRSAYAQARAVAYQNRLPFIERSMAVASYAYSRRDYDTAIDAYRRLLERYPDNTRAMNNLAIIHRDRHQYVAAESLFTRAAEIDSTIANFYFGIQGTQLMQGKFAESRRTLDLIARRFPGNPVSLTIEIQDAAAQQHWDEAERRAETRIAAARGDTLDLIDPYEALSGIMMTQGRLAEAERNWRTQLALSEATKSYGRHLFGVMQLAYLELLYRRSPARALALVDSALARRPLHDLLPADRPYEDLARFYARAGRPARARQLLIEADANDKELGRTTPPERTWARGVLALAEGRSADAQLQLRQAADAIVCTICALPDLARADEAVVKPEAAVVVYERYLATPWFWRYEPDAVELGRTMQRLAALYDARNEPAKAIAMRQRLVQLWQRADPELGRELDEARGRLVSGR